MSEESYRRFKGVWEDPEAAGAYQDTRFSRSRRWRWTDSRERAILQALISALPAGSLGLDLPCGAGRISALFNRVQLRYVGADVSLSMLRLARQDMEHRPFLGADALRLPFSSGAFDFLISVRLFHRIREPETRVAMLREMARVTQGLIVVTYYSRWNLRGVQRWIKGKDPGLSLAEIERDARMAGLQLARRIPLRRWSQQQWFFVLEKRLGAKIA